MRDDIKEQEYEMNNEVKMIRNFIPVGQGAFYRETFYVPENQDDSCDKINIVYDCGSTSKTLINKRIESTFEKGDVIEALFISHFHEDHVNGIPKLMERCVVKKIFLPYITEKNRKILLTFLLKITDSKKQNKTYAYSFLSDLSNIKALSRYDNLDTKIYLVYANSDLKEFENWKNDAWARNADDVIESGTEIHLIDPKNDSDEKEKSLILLDNSNFNDALINGWKYIPYNMEHTKEKIEEFEKRIKQDFPEVISFEDSPELLNDIKKIQKLKKCYDILGDVNTNSMLVLSTKDNISIGVDLAELKISEVHPGCLYMGDFDCNGKYTDVENAYGNYLKSVCIIQIPHHGSKINYDSKIATSKEAVFYIISVGSTNKYKHPSFSVIDDLLLKKDCMVFTVTEKMDSGVFFLITYHFCKVNKLKVCNGICKKK